MNKYKIVHYYEKDRFQLKEINADYFETNIDNGIMSVNLYKVVKTKSICVCAFSNIVFIEKVEED